MHIILGVLLLILIPLTIAVPYLLVDLTRNMNPIVGTVIIWAMFGLGYIYGKAEQRNQTRARAEREAEAKALDARDKARGIGKYANPSK